MNLSNYNLKELEGVVFIPIEEIPEGETNVRFLTATHEGLKFAFAFSNLVGLVDFFQSEQFYVQMLGAELLDKLIEAETGLGFNFTNTGEGNLWNLEDLRVIREALQTVIDENRADGGAVLALSEMSAADASAERQVRAVLSAADYIGKYAVLVDNEGLVVALTRSAFHDDGEARFAVLDRDFRFSDIAKALRLVMIEDEAPLWQEIAEITELKCLQPAPKAPKIPNLRV